MWKKKQHNLFLYNIDSFIALNEYNFFLTCNSLYLKGRGKNSKSINHSQQM